MEDLQKCACGQDCQAHSDHSMECNCEEGCQNCEHCNERRTPVA